MGLTGIHSPAFAESHLDFAAVVKMVFRGEHDFDTLVKPGSVLRRSELSSLQIPRGQTLFVFPAFFYFVVVVTRFAVPTFRTPYAGRGRLPADVPGRTHRTLLLVC